MKKNSGSVAIPFLVTILVTLILFGGAAVIVYRQYTKDDTVLKPMQLSGTLISEADNLNFLCVLDTQEIDVPAAYMLVRFDPVVKKITCLGIPNSLEMRTDDGTTTPDLAYKNGGISALRKAVSANFSVPVDYYMAFDAAGFERFCDMIGGVEITVPAKIKGLPEVNKLDYLNGSQMVALFSHDYDGDEMQRCTINSFALSQMLNQSDNERILQSLDSVVTSTLELANTDVSVLVYREHEHALKFIVQYTPYCAGYYMPTATYADGRYVLSDSCREEITGLFS